MKKFKKIIVYLCLFLLSFSIVTDFKRQETQAIALVDDALLWAFGMLVLGTGVVAINNLQVPHMGSLVFDKLKTDGVSEEEFLIKSSDSVLKGIKIYDKVLNAVDYVAENLTSSDSSVAEPSYDDSLNLYSFSINSVGTLPQGVVFPLFRAKILSDNIGSIKFSSSLGSYNINPTGYLVGDEFEIMYYGVDNVRSKFQYRIWRNNKYLTGGVFLNSFDTFVTGIKVTYSSSLSCNFLVDDNLNYIPYSNPVVKENYNPTYTDQNLPYTAEKPGFIPLPTETIMDKPISTELPLTWDDVKGGVTDLPVDDTIPGEDTGEGEIETPSGWGWLLDILKSILNAILSIPGAILDFFEIDWTLVGEHVVYDEIFKTKFKPFYDVIYLLQNINVNPSTHSGKFYMVIPPEMGGDGQEHCVLDLTVGNEYIVMARAFINASIWIGFLWYIIKLFSPNLDIG